MPEITRRRALAALVGGASLSAAGYAGVRVAARTGRVVGKHVVVEVGDRRRVTQLLTAEHDDDGSVSVRLHPSREELFSDEPPVVVSAETHDRLTDRYETVRYHLAQTCPNADCSTPRVSRETFNEASLGSTVELFYHGDRATSVG